MQVSRSRPLLLTVKPAVFATAVGMATLLHFLLLAFNIISVKSLSVVSGGDKSIFSKNENARAVIIVSSQVSKSYALVSMSVTSQCTHPSAHLLPLCPSADQAFLFLSSSRSLGADQAFFPSLYHVQISFPKVPTRLPPPQLHRQSCSDLLVTGEQQLLQTAVQPVFTMTGTGGSGLQIVSEKLSETNYASWTVDVELYVEGHDKLDILHGTKVKPDEKDPSFRTWRRDNIQLMTWMLNSVNSGIKQVILHNKTAYDMWKTLEQMYGRRHDMLCTYQISSQILKLEQGSMSVANYFATLKRLWDEFDYYRMENWSSTDDHQRYLKLLEKDRIIKFLDGLTAEFESLKGQILGLDPTPSLEQVYYKILSEEGRKRTMNNKGISTGGPSIGETSVFIGSANKFRPGGTKRQGDRFCRHCKRTNHDSDFCWEKYPEKKPEKFKHNAKKAPNSSNIAIQKLESEETIGSSVSSITGLSSTDIVNLQHLLSRLQASSSASTPADSTPFQAHTGATDHMTNAVNSFISYSLSSGQEKVIIADGTKATVAGKGSIKLTDHFFLSSALHDLETKQTIGTGREVGGLYYYQLETTSALKSAAKLVVPQVVSSPIPLDVIENRKDAPSLGKDAPSLGAQSSPDIITYKRRRHKQDPTIDRLVESDALAPDPVKQLSSSVEPTAPLNMNELDLPVAIRKGVRKYVLDLLKETGKLGSRPASTPIEVNHDLTSSSGEDLTSLEKGTYQRLVGKLLYLSMTRPDITYAVSVVSQYMHAPKTIHMKAVDRILRYLKSCPGKGLLFKGGGDLKKTLPVLVAVVEQLHGALGEPGLLVLPCVAAHIIQIIIDSFIVNLWLRKDQMSAATKEV
ncbi:hypothetical protein ZIOFF_031906 [Zingiber officinale]|uniref:Uncharacterized protein n=1 Tax=Zingiber officinale TaxID=94328 RepID=A0A8J5GFK9_ZINOF|nr:hypothetical protein ZIOFF_031906 [Zingiber officinale]